MTDLSNLISRLEAAEGPSRELDRAIADELGTVTTYQVDDDEDYGPFGSTRWHWPHYTASLDAARTISNWVLITASDIAGDGLAFVRLGNPSKSSSLEASGCHNHLSIAWCIAALYAFNFERTHLQ